MNTLSKIVLLSSLVIVGIGDLQAACLIKNSNNQATTQKGDALFSVLQTALSCPQNVQNLKAALLAAGHSTNPYLVANRGIHNPALGSFSFFEEVLGNNVGKGQFFFGHFTGVDNNQIIADQEPTKGKLMIELIVWDSMKKLFNFYELIGTGKGGQWFYSGDSADILADNAQLYLNPQGPKFGTTLRCSGCHSSGGPIMKELSAPHNDWWTTARPLPFAPNILSTEVAHWVQQLKEASEFSQSIKTGIELLEQSVPYQEAKQQFSLQATLRPLFCETEINLESDITPLNLVSLAVQIPTASIVSPLLAKGSLSMELPAYVKLLNLFNLQFPETTNRDADHAWLTPVKGYSDLAAIQTLIKNDIVSEEFVADVLAVDFENPVLSSKRCKLIQLIPAEGLSNFAERLKESNFPLAKELNDNLTNPEKTKVFHAQKAKDHLENTQALLKTSNRQTQLFKRLMKNRMDIFSAEISRNPRGQILEPGFRVIFPVPQ